MLSHRVKEEQNYMNYILIEGDQSTQGSQAWLDFRKNKIGASIAPIIIGVSPWQTRLQLWEQMMSDTQIQKNKAMQRGNDLEPKARAWLSAKLSIDYQPVVVQRVEYPQIIASLDGYYQSGDEKPKIIEIKCPGEKAHMMAINGKIPDYYYPQLQHQMDAVGVDFMYYVSFDGENGVILEVRRDIEYCQNLLAEELSFFFSLQNFIPPEPTDRDWIEDNDPRRLNAAIEYKKIKDQIAKLEFQKVGIYEFLTDTNYVRSKVGDLKIQKVKKRGHVDYSKIDVLKGLDLEPYRKENSECWRIF